MIKKLLPIILLYICCFGSYAQSKQILLDNSKSGSRNNFTINESNLKHLKMSAHFSAINISTAKSEDGDFCELHIDGAYYTGAEGEPQLPAIRKLVQIPHGAKFTVKTICTDTSQFALGNYGIDKQIVPHQPSQSKSGEKQKFKHNRKSYKRNSFTLDKLVSVTKVGTLRGVDLCQVTINPIRYNPKKNAIMVFNDIDIELSFEENHAKADEHATSPYFETLLSGISNYKSTAADLTKYPVKYLIITDTAFTKALDEFVAWKTMKGFNVIVATIDTIGNTPAEIKSWITKQYNSATENSPAPSFLLLAADTDKIPCSKTGVSSKYGTDLYYACMDGEDDIIPDIYYGRFSARTAEQMKAIADKTVTYEKYQFEDPSYLAKATLIAGYDRTWRPSVGVPTLTYITNNRINASNGYKNVNKFTTKYTGCYDDTTVSVGLMTYTAHGQTTTWEDPLLEKADVNKFSNYGKYPFVIANCCLSGNITTAECLGETWIRKANSGAVAYIGSSPKTYWCEDFYWAVGAHNYKSGRCPSVEETSNGAFDAPFVSDFVCGDAILYAGNLAVTEAHDNSYPSDVSTQYYWEGYNYLGDPSLLVYFGEGKENPVTHEIAHALSDNLLEIHASEGSYVAISRNGTLIDAKTVDAGSDCTTLDISSITETGICDIVVTKARHKPYIGNIEIITPNQPHLVVTKATLDKSVINGDTPRLNLVLKNAGKISSNNSTIKIESNSPFVRKITMGKNSLKDLGYLDECAIDSICSIELADNIADQTKITLDITITDGNLTFSHTFPFYVNAPVIQLNNQATIKNAIGILMPGDTSNLEIEISNTGHQSMENVKMEIIPDNGMDFITFDNNNQTITKIEACSQTACQFSISADENTDLLTPFSFSVIATYSDNVSISDTAHYSIVIGKPYERQIGNGKIVATYPFNNYYLCGKNQIIYTANDLGDKPMQLKGMSFNVKQATSPKEFDGYANLTIKIKKTDANQISKYFDMNDAQVVYKSNLFSIPQAGITTFEFDSAFNYDGKSNIVVEIIWGENSKYVDKDQRTRVYCHQTSTNTIGYDFEDDMDDIYFYNSTNERPNTTFLYLNQKCVFFTITDEDGTPIENATISINGESIQTDINGAASVEFFGNIPNKAYTIYALGYNKITGQIQKNTDSIYIAHKLSASQLYCAAIHIIDSASQTDIANASTAISIIDTTVYTNNSGIAHIDSIYYAYVKLTSTADYYFSKESNVEISSDTIITIKLNRYPSATIQTVSDNGPVSDAQITLDGKSVPTDSLGVAHFYDLAPGQHSIKITHCNYREYTYTFRSDRLNKDTVINLTELPSIKIVALYEEMPMSDAAITINQKTFTTDTAGAILISHYDKNDLIFNLEWDYIHNITDTIKNIVSDTIVNVRFEVPLYSLNFYIHKQSTPISGIPVCIYNQTIKSGDNGYAEFLVNPSKALPFSIKASDTYTINDTIPITNSSTVDIILDYIDTVRINTDTISRTDTIIIISNDTAVVIPPVTDTTAQKPINTDTIKVQLYLSDGFYPLNTVSVTLNDSTKLTDANGFATFYGLKAGDLMNYTIRKDGYTTTDGKTEASWSTICGGNTKIEITLVPTDTTSATMQSEDLGIYPNPSNGTIHIPDNFIGCHLRLFDTKGNMLKSLVATDNTVNLQPVMPGTYLMVATTPDGTLTCVIVIR